MLLRLLNLKILEEPSILIDAASTIIDNSSLYFKSVIKAKALPPIKAGAESGESFYNSLPEPAADTLECYSQFLMSTESIENFPVFVRSKFPKLKNIFSFLCSRNRAASTASTNSEDSGIMIDAQSSEDKFWDSYEDFNALPPEILEQEYRQGNIPHESLPVPHIWHYIVGESKLLSAKITASYATYDYRVREGLHLFNGFWNNTPHLFLIHEIALKVHQFYSFTESLPEIFNSHTDMIKIKRKLDSWRYLFYYNMQTKRYGLRT